MKVKRLRNRESMWSTSDKIALMEVYRDEWKHRDQMFTSYMWRFVTISLIVTFLPNVLGAKDMFPEVAKTFPLWVFPLVGMLCSVLGMYVGFAENKRIKYIDQAYRRIETTLPVTFQTEKIHKSVFKLTIIKLLFIVMHIVTFTLGMLNFRFYLV